VPDLIIPRNTKPELVQYQENLIAQGDPQSPFMKTQRVPKIRVDSNYDIIENRRRELRLLEGEKAKAEEFHTIPLEAYDPCIDVEEGDKVLEKFRNKDGRVKGRSRWFFPDGTNEFRDCEILSYDPKEKRYVIKWAANGLIKKASRFNIRIEGEDPSLLIYRVNMATKSRHIAELIIECLTHIDNIPIALPTFPDTLKERISYYTRAIPQFSRSYRDVIGYLAMDPETRGRRARYKFVIPSLGVAGEFRAMKKAGINVNSVKVLFNEVEKNYKQSFKIMEFEAQLPYKEEYYEKFKEIIPLAKFNPAAEKIIEETNTKGVIEIKDRSRPFFGLLKEMNKKLNQGDSKKLKTLLSVNANCHKLLGKYYFDKRSDKAIELKTYFDMNVARNHDIISDWKEFMIQASNEIIGIHNDIKGQIDADFKMKLEAAYYESARRNVGESKIPEEVLQTMIRFQELVNFIFERGIRQSFEGSVERFIQNYDTIRNFMADSLGFPSEALETFEFTIEDLRKIADDAIFKYRMRNMTRLKCLLKYDSNIGVYISPRINKWKEGMMNLIYDTMKAIMNCPCLFSAALGYARESRVVMVIENLETDPFTIAKKEELEKILDGLLHIPIQLEKVANQYRDILSADKESIKETFSKTSVTNEEYDAELGRLKNAQQRLNTLFPEDTMSLGLFIVNCKYVKDFFSVQITKLTKLVCQCVKHRIVQHADTIDNTVKEIVTLLEEEPPMIEKLVEQNKFIQGLERKRRDIQNVIIAMIDKITLLEEYQHPLNEKEYARNAESFGRTLDILKLKRNAVVRNASLWGLYKDKLKHETSLLLIEAGQLKERFDLLQVKNDLENYSKITYEYNQLGEDINQAINKAELVLTREKLFLLTNTSFEELYNTKKLFIPYEHLWNITRDYFDFYPQWTTGPITDLNRDKLMEDMNMSINDLRGFIANEFASDASTQEIAKEVLQKFLDFKPLIPLIYDLRNPAMQKRHWDVLNQITGLDIPADGKISLNELLSRGIEKWKEQVNDISDFASKEKTLLHEIEKMRKEWGNIKFEMKPYLDTGIYLIKSLPRVVEKLEEQITRTLVLTSSPYTKYIEL